MLVENGLHHKNSLLGASALVTYKPQHRYGRPSLVVLVLFQTEKNVNKHSIPPRKRKSIPAGRGSENGRGQVLGGQSPPLFAQLGGLGDAAPT